VSKGSLMRTRTSFYLLTAAVLFCVSLHAEVSDSQPFSLKAGDTVVFYGDSITEQSLYNQWVELYTVTRFPRMRVHFYGAGVGGDRVTGGSGGTIDERLARDVFPHHPSVITIMLGMNDGGYGPASDEIQSAYTRGYEHLLASMREHAPNARITLLGPSPFDDVTRAERFPGGYNGVQRGLGKLDEGLAKKFDGSFIDLNPPVVAMLERAQALDPLVARLMLPDRVHPDYIAHWVMAETLLDGWNAPALVSSVTIDARAAKALDTQHAAVDSVVNENDQLRWSETDDSLPLPFDKSNQSQALLLQLTDVQQRLNQEMLRVTGLDPGRYTLKIDDESIGPFSAEDLASGVNLADFATPMRSQAQRVSWLVRDRGQTHSIHMRMLIRNAPVSSQPGGLDVMEAFENSLEDAIYEEAAPKLHMFTLSRAEEASK
jgi:lysophospholipase L1-like esterase